MATIAGGVVGDTTGGIGKLIIISGWLLKGRDESPGLFLSLL